MCIDSSFKKVKKVYLRVNLPEEMRFEFAFWNKVREFAKRISGKGAFQVEAPARGRSLRRKNS